MEARSPLAFLLAGGSGFIGTHVASGLIARGHAVTVLSRGRAVATAGAARVTADRRDPTGVARALEGRRFDLTVDFLAYDAPDFAWLGHLPPAVPGRVVMISTGQVYLVGEGPTPPYREEASDSPTIPEPAAGTEDHAQWTYGVGKRRAERALERLGVTRGIAGVALRLPIVQGEGDRSLRLWAYLERMLDGGPIVLPDGGRRPVRHIDAGDLAAVLVRLALGPAPRSLAYNLAQPDVLPLRVFLERVAEAAGVRARFVDASWDACRAAGLDDRFSPYAGEWSSVVDPARAIAELGFAGTPSEDYLPRVVRWHLEHRPPSHEGYRQRAVEGELAGRLVP